MCVCVYVWKNYYWNNDLSKHQNIRFCNQKYVILECDEILGWYSNVSTQFQFWMDLSNGFACISNFRMTHVGFKKKIVGGKFLFLLLFYIVHGVSYTWMTIKFLETIYRFHKYVFSYSQNSVIFRPLFRPLYDKQ